MKDYNEAIRLKPTEGVYYGDRGWLYLLLGDFDHALADFGDELKRIGTEDEGNGPSAGNGWKTGVADAESLKAQDTTVTLGGSK